MPHSISRRRLICNGTALVLGSGAGAAALAQSAASQPAASQPARDRPPPLPPELVLEFVKVAHGKLELVQQMLSEQPRLVNATWDWSNGDFESAIGAAAHMGRADIAGVLLEHGARMDIPAAAMLGKLEIVRAACEALPGTHLIPGAHGIPLIEHARKGGPAAEAVLRYLESLA